MRTERALITVVLIVAAGCGSQVTEQMAWSDPGSEAPDAGGESDAGPSSDAGVDAPEPVDAGSELYAALEGIWLVGWSGGMNHFSWARFRMSEPNPGWGEADFLAGEDIEVNDPFWPCSGLGAWALAQKPWTVQITLPEGCGDPAPQAYTFISVTPAEGNPMGVTHYASVETGPPPGQYFEAYKFAPSQCDAAMTSCDDPFL
jgi:hypothetical protein